MLPTLIWTSLLFFTSAFVSADSVCEKAQYAEYAPLSSYGPAADFCENSFPAPECKDGTLIVTSVTATSTVFTTITSTSSSTTAVLTSTFTSGGTTATVTAPTSTSTETLTTSWVVVFETTITYVPGLVTARDVPACTAVPASCTTYVTTSLVPVGLKTVSGEQHTCLSSLKQQPSSVISTACSCIAPQASCVDAMATTTKLIEATSTSTITKTIITEIAVTTTTTVEAFYATTITPVVTTTTTSISYFSKTYTAIAAADGDHCYGGTRCIGSYASQQRCGQRIDVAGSGLAVNERHTVDNLYSCFRWCATGRECIAYDYFRDTKECVFYLYDRQISEIREIETIPAVGIDSAIMFSGDCSKST